MPDTNLEQLQYPIGRFKKGLSYSLAEINNNIELFSAFPNKLESLVKNWDTNKLSIRYREGGWSGQQVINHLGDSHGQLLLRFKSCLTSENAQIMPYDEAKWAELYDTLNCDINYSLQIINAVHARLSVLLKNLTESDFQKATFHPESKYKFTLAELLALYVWHGQHHLEHLKIIDRNS